MRASRFPKRLARLALLLLLLAPVVSPSTAHAATFTVHSTGDASDAVPGDAVCATATGECTLRAAIQEANALPGLDSIAFNIPPGGVQAIIPTSALPDITDPLVIDGTTQPGFVGTPIIELSGPGLYAAGLVITAGGSTIRGLIISQFWAGGLWLQGGSGNIVEGNFIWGNDIGVTMHRSANNLVGGITAAARNVISGNWRYGVFIADFPTAGNIVQGNFIGTDATGIAPLGNGSHGVYIGGSAPGGASDNSVIGNTIAYNAGAGVFVGLDGFDFVSFQLRNSINGNSIHDNSGLGIDLDPNGVTPNDPTDPDEGPNNLQNFPVLTSAAASGGNLTVEGTLNSTPNTSFTLQFFGNTACDPSGYGEGKTFVGSTVVVTDGAGDIAFSATLPVGGPFGALVTSTATDPNGSTSEFSQCIGVNLDPADAPWPMFHHDLQHTGRSPYSGPSHPALKWALDTGGPIWASPAVGSDGTIYVSSQGGGRKLYAVNPDGSVKWTFPVGGLGNQGDSSPAIGADGTVYVGSHGGFLYAVNPNGSLKWSYNTGLNQWSSPAIAQDGTVYMGANTGNLYAVNPDGSLKWTFPTGDYGGSSPAIGGDGTVYVSSVDKNVYAINPDGSLKWTLAMPYVNYRSSPAVGIDGTVYTGFSNSYALYAIAANGQVEWSFQTNGGTSSSVAIGANGTLYIGSCDGKLYAVNPDGSLQWSFSTGNCIFSSPAIGADGTVYAGSGDDNLYAINSNGTLKWSVNTGISEWAFSSPAIGADGTVYVGSEDGKLYAIREAVPAAVGNLRTGVDSDSASGVVVAIPQVVDALNGQPVPGVLLGAYGATLTYAGDLVNALDVRLKPPFDNGTFNIDNPAGSTALLGYAVLGAPWPVDPLAFLPLRLLGCANQEATVTLAFAEVVDVDLNPLGLPPPVVRTFRRGDAKPDGVTSAADLLYTVQHVAGLRPAGDGPGQVNAVNAASVKQDGAIDQVTAADALELAQLLVGLRDPCFNLLPAGSVPLR